MATGIATLQSRKMVGRLPQIDCPGEAMVLRVQPTLDSRWLLERYSGVGDRWYALSYYDNRHQAFEDAERRREQDAVILVCSKCDGVLGEDHLLSCPECGFTGHIEAPPAEHTLYGASSRFSAYAVAIGIVAFIGLAETIGGLLCR